MRGGVRHLIDNYIRKGGYPDDTSSGLEQLNMLLLKTYACLA